MVNTMWYFQKSKYQMCVALCKSKGVKRADDYDKDDCDGGDDNIQVTLMVTMLWFEVSFVSVQLYSDVKQKLSHNNENDVIK